MKLFKFYMSILIILSVLFGLTSNSFFTLWLSMELSSLMFIPLLTININQMFSESSMKYFLIQSCCSLGMIFIFSTSNFLFMNLNKNLFLCLILIVILMMKVGVFPFFFWYIDVLMKISFFNMFLLMTIQKLIPLFIMEILWDNSFNMFILFFLSLNMIIPSLMIFNFFSVKKILSISSVGQISWMILSILFNLNLFFLFMMIYSFLVSLILNFTSKFNIKDLKLIMNYKFFPLSMSLLIMSGLPPFPIFLIKWFIFINLMNQQLLTFSLIVLISSLITMFYFTRLMLFTLFLSSSKSKMLKWEKKEKSYFIFIFMLMITSSFFMI